MNDGVEIVFSFPLVVEQAVGGVVRRKLGQALPAIGFPFDGAVSAMELPDAIARMLGLPVGF
jgi:hypothetical protein